MKKIAIYALMLIAMATGLGSCTGDYAQPPVNIPEGGIGNGSWQDPITAYQAHLGTEISTNPIWVKGYIVGWINTNINNVLKEETAMFTAPAGVNTNLLIASDPEEKDWTKCATVQLPSGEVRNALNLVTNPENLGKMVSIYGTTGSKYCSAYGVRSVTDFNWGEEGKEPDPATILPEGSVTVWNVKLLTDTQGFTFEEAPGNPKPLWSHSTQYGLVANGGKPSGNYWAWAISPVVSVEKYSEPRVQVHQAANYFNNTATFREMTKVAVREEGGEWTYLDFPLPPAGNSWSFTNSGYINLDDFAGKKIQIGFYYTCSPSVSGSWEIDEVTVTGVIK